MAGGGLTRRQVLGRSAIIALTHALTGNSIMAEDKMPGAKRIGLQLYTLREPLAADFAGTLQQVAAIGFRELEFAGYHGHEPAAVADLLEQYGLEAPSAHVPIDMLRDHLDRLLDAAHIVGHRYLVMPWLAPEQRASLAHYQAHAALFNHAGERCRKAGIQLAYHNHDFEFQAIDGTLPYDLLLRETDPGLLQMELDLYWARKAGQDPLAYCRNHPGRFALCHVKDMASDGSMADVGRGVIDYARLLPALRSAGVEHFFVEHDQPADPIASIRYSFASLARMTF